MLRESLCATCILLTSLYFLIQATSFVFSLSQLPRNHFFFLFFCLLSKIVRQRESDRRMATDHITRTADQYNVELLPSDDDAPPPLSSSWRLSLDTFRLPSSTGRHDGRTRFSRYFRTPSEFFCSSLFFVPRDLRLIVFHVDHHRT